MAYNTVSRSKYFDKFQQEYFNSKRNKKTCTFKDSSCGSNFKKPVLV
jgi:hypothetical protein